MARWQLFEFEDQAWLPVSVRDGMTDYMRFLELRFDLYGRILVRLYKALRRGRQPRVIDLCSGGGGPWPVLAPRLDRRWPRTGNERLVVRLTDRFPNARGMRTLAASNPETFRLHTTPVDALHPPPQLAGTRTLFSAFHHFRPQAARRILQAAAERGEAIAVFEMTQRHPLYFLYMLTAPLQVLLLTPFIRPHSFSRILWTYLIPLIPFCILWDGLVSGLRTYTPEELRGLLAGLPGTGYRWEVGLARFGPLPVGITWLIGYPAPTRPIAPGD